MQERSQFTFYRSFWDAVKGLPKKDKLPVLEAIISYALDGENPNGLTQTQNAFFLLVKPNLDASRKKAANGKQGGSKSKAKCKQTASEKENEIENENEVEVEIEKEYECNNGGSGSSAAARATASAIAAIGLKPGEFPATSVDQVAAVHELGGRLFRTYARGLRYGPADLRHIFCRVALGQGIDVGAAGLLEYAFEAAHKAGKAGNWNYIEAVLDRCYQQGLTTAENARAFDEERPDLEEGWTP